MWIFIFIIALLFLIIFIAFLFDERDKKSRAIPLEDEAVRQRQAYLKHSESQKLNIVNRPLPKIISAPYIPKEEYFDQIELPDKIATIKLNILAQIRYSDAKDQISERRITIRKIQKSYYDTDYFINAFCHERQAERTFKLSRMSSLVDIETGEKISDINKFFSDRFIDSPIGLISKCIQEYEAEIMTLVFIARADGYLRKKERDLINDFLSSKYPSIDYSLLDGEIRNTYCNSTEFRKMLKKIRPDCRKEIIDYSIQIVDSDKNIDQMELGMLDLLKSELK
jgi:hypothetical protein